MRKTMPVRECMSRLPAETDRRERLSTVVDQMREQHCHHVPVMDGHRLYGILSRQDLHELALKGGPPGDDVVAGDVCTRDVLTVGPMTPITPLRSPTRYSAVTSVKSDSALASFSSPIVIRSRPAC